MQQDSSINQTQKQVSEHSLCNRRIHTYIYINKKTVTKIEKLRNWKWVFLGLCQVTEIGYERGSEAHERENEGDELTQ